MLCLQVTTLKSLNDALNCLDVSVRPSNPKFPSDPAGHWNVLDGRALLRYKDGLVRTCNLPLYVLHCLYAHIIMRWKEASVMDQGMQFHALKRSCNINHGIMESRS